MPMIRVDDEVYETLRDLGKTGDSFNNVMRKVLKLEARQRIVTELEQIEPDSEKRKKLCLIINRYLPKKWADRRAPNRFEYILYVVERFLYMPKDQMIIKERYIQAKKEVAEALNLHETTIHDKCGRQLYDKGTRMIGNFYEALEAIENDCKIELAGYPPTRV